MESGATVTIPIFPGAYGGVNAKFQIVCKTPFGSFTYNPDKNIWESLAEEENPYTFHQVLTKSYNLHVFSGYLPAGEYELILTMDMIQDQHYEYPELGQISESFTLPVLQ